MAAARERRVRGGWHADCGNNHMGRGVRTVWIFQSFLILSSSEIERVHQDEVEQGYMKHGRKNKWDKLHKKT